jgi:hypothetical protein
MSAAISAISSLGASGLNPPSNRGILENQLNRYETQLADWCSCPSGKTPDGEKKIAELQDKAAALRVQLQRLDAARLQPSGAVAAVQMDPPQAAAISLVGTLLDVNA